MLWARRQGLFSRHYDVTAENAPVTTLTRGSRESCEFTLSEAAYRIERDTRRRFELHGPEGRIAVAEQETGRRWRVSAPSGNLQLVRPSLFRTAWEVHQRGSSRGEIRGRGFWGMNVSAEVPGDVPLPVALFALYVILMIFGRQAAASAAG